MRETYSENPHFLKYQELTVALHELFRQGVDEGPQLDALYEQMADEASFLTPAQRERVGELSGDLYLLQHDEVFSEVTDQTQLMSLAQQMADAQNEQDWLRVLELLRTRPPGVADEMIARLRGHAYLGLEQFEAARPFLEFALEHFPDDPTVRYEYLATLFNLDEGIRAAEVGAEWRPRSVRDSLWVTCWATAVISAADTEDPRAPVWLNAARRLLGGIVEQPGFEQIPRSFRLHSLLILSAVSLRMHDTVAALDWWQQALLLHTGDEETTHLLQFQGRELVREMAETFAIAGVDVRADEPSDMPTRQQVWESLVSPTIIEQIDEQTGERARHLYEGGITSEPVVA